MTTMQDLYEFMKDSLPLMGLRFHDMNKARVTLDGRSLTFSANGRSVSFTPSEPPPPAPLPRRCTAAMLRAAREGYHCPANAPGELNSLKAAINAALAVVPYPGPPDDFEGAM